MRVRVIAVGTRMPGWVVNACDGYLSRMASGPSVALEQIAAAARAPGSATGRAVAAEGARLLRLLRPGEHLTALDERGAQLSTREFAAWLGERMQRGEDLAFVIGGADGLAAEVLARSRSSLALSRLTLPHALARVLLLEQLYRARAILRHHPYHRD